MSEEVKLYQLDKSMFNDPEIRAFIKDSIKEGIKETRMCPIPKDVTDKMTHWAESIKTIGSGEFDKGVERIRKNHEFIHELREAKRTAVKWIMRPILVLLSITVLCAVYFGFTGKNIPFK